MLHLIHTPLAEWDQALPQVALCVDRITLAKRLWRAFADDQTEFAFELNAPLRHGDVVYQTATARYVIQQQAEPLVEISLDVAASAAAGIGWAIGNLHLELAAEPTRLLAPDEPAVRQLLARINVPYQVTSGIFRPGRFSRGNQPNHELGTSHKH
jgi:urease accessory protein